MGVRPGTNWVSDDLDYIGRPRETRYDSWGTAEIITEYKEGISTGLALDNIAELGPLHRQLLQDTDFHAVGRTLLKKLDTEEENERFGFDGRDLSGDLKTILLALDEIGLDSSTLKSTIRLADGNTETLDWITNNWETFLEVKPDDALATAELGQAITEDKGGRVKDSYRIVDVFRKSFFKEASERRLVHLRRRLEDLQECNHPEEIEKYLWTIREVYEEDRTLITLWSTKKKQEERKMYLDGLHRRREQLEKRFNSKKEPLDFEAIRRKVWFCFDREREEKIVEQETRPLKSEWMKYVDKRTGKIKEEGYLAGTKESSLQKFIAEKVTTPPAIWEIEKSKAFCDLNQTRTQWNKLYEKTWHRMGDIIISRLRVIKTSTEGFVLARYIKRFQFRLDPKVLGEVILEKAKKIQTEGGKNVIRTLLASCQYQLDKDTTAAIVEELTKRRI